MSFSTGGGGGGDGDPLREAATGLDGAVRVASESVAAAISSSSSIISSTALEEDGGWETVLKDRRDRLLLQDLVEPARESLSEPAADDEVGEDTALAESDDVRGALVATPESFLTLVLRELFLGGA